MRNHKTNGKFEFYIYDSSSIKRNIIFTQTNAYNENPINNSFYQKSGNFYYSSLNTLGTLWRGLSLGIYGNRDMQINCSLSMSYEGSSWTYCLQDQLKGAYNTGPWFSDNSKFDINSQQWINTNNFSSF